MPRKIEEALKRSARARGYEPGTDKYRRYVYGTLTRIKAGRKANGGK